MYGHAPHDYDCPFCSVVAGVEDELHSKQDIVFENELVLAFISPKWWVNNPGHVLVISKQHIENLYDISESDLAEVYKVVKKVAIAIRSTYGCEGTSTRQHNEPAGNQDVWHFHVHVFPRYEGDDLYENHDNKQYNTGNERLVYANMLREYFASNEIGE